MPLVQAGRWEQWVYPTLACKVGHCFHPLSSALGGQEVEGLCGKPLEGTVSCESVPQSPTALTSCRHMTGSRAALIPASLSRQQVSRFPFLLKGTRMVCQEG